MTKITIKQNGDIEIDTLADSMPERKFCHGDGEFCKDILASDKSVNGELSHEFVEFLESVVDEVKRK
jgi:hypothetical protein